MQFSDRLDGLWATAAQWSQSQKYGKHTESFEHRAARYWKLNVRSTHGGKSTKIVSVEFFGALWSRTHLSPEQCREKLNDSRGSAKAAAAEGEEGKGELRLPRATSWHQRDTRSSLSDFDKFTQAGLNSSLTGTALEEMYGRTELSATCEVQQLLRTMLATTNS